MPVSAALLALGVILPLEGRVAVEPPRLLISAFELADYIKGQLNSAEGPYGWVPHVLFIVIENKNAC